MVILGYVISGPDNDSYMYEGVDGVPACRGCSLVTDSSWLNLGFVLRLRTFDLSFTYDGACIASDRFMKAVAGLPGLDARPLPSVAGFNLLTASQVVRFDSERRHTRFEDQCDICGRFTAVAGATPAFLLPGEEVPWGFSRSDVAFGSVKGPGRAYAQHPLLIASTGAATRLSETNVDPLDIKAIQV